MTVAAAAVIAAAAVEAATLIATAAAAVTAAATPAAATTAAAVVVAAAAIIAAAAEIAAAAANRKKTYGHQQWRLSRRWAVQGARDGGGERQERGEGRSMKPIHPCLPTGMVILLTLQTIYSVTYFLIQYTL